MNTNTNTAISDILSIIGDDKTLLNNTIDYYNLIVDASDNSKNLELTLNLLENYTGKEINIMFIKYRNKLIKIIKLLVLIARNNKIEDLSLLYFKLLQKK